MPKGLLRHFQNRENRAGKSINKNLEKGSNLSQWSNFLDDDTEIATNDANILFPNFLQQAAIAIKDIIYY